jgi:hypothetical protein
MVEQPIPSVTRADVERVVRRDFLPAQYEEVLALLGEYGGEDWHREADRVHLAILKLSSGDIDTLRHEVAIAKSDYRDVLAPAEYPTCMRQSSSTFQLPPKERRRIFDQDWQQYQDWLQRLA